MTNIAIPENPQSEQGRSSIALEDLRIQIAPDYLENSPNRLKDGPIKNMYFSMPWDHYMELKQFSKEQGHSVSEDLRTAAWSSLVLIHILNELDTPLLVEVEGELVEIELPF